MNISSSILTTLAFSLILSTASTPLWAQETQPVIPVPPPAAAPAPSAPPSSAPPMPGNSPGVPAGQTPGQAPGQAPGQTSGQGSGEANPGVAAAQPAAPPVVSANYVIGPPDSLSISVWKEPSLSGNVQVRPDGMISLPLVGDVKADGLTPLGLAAQLTDMLKKYINDPLVTVTVVGINSKHIYLTGNIARGGELAFNPDMTPMQVIISAGGVSPLAKKSKVYILRNVNGKQVKIPFDYKKALKTGDQQGVVLLPNDTIVVP